MSKLTKIITDEVKNDRIGVYVDKNSKYWIGIMVMKMPPSSSFSTIKKRIIKALTREFGIDVTK